ncbi:MAG: CYCXC family (seleno)protein [Candidatus Acidiferrum sp.]
MRQTQKLFGGITLLVAGLALALIPQQASSRSVGTWKQVANVEPIPAYHTSAPEGSLPATLSPSLFTDPIAQNAYRLAANIKRILYQQPCYCHCDRSQGHGSLLDCYTGKHAAECGTCVRENFYSYEQTRKGKSAAQIREGIERGDWQHVDMTKYESPMHVK